MSGQKEHIIIDFLKQAQKAPKAIGQKAGLAVRTSFDVVTYPGQRFSQLISAQSKSTSNKAQGPRLGKTDDREARKEGMKEAFKTHYQELREQQDKMDELVEKSGQTLTRIRNIIPIFTDEIIVDTNKITIIDRPFFFSEHIKTIPIQTVSHVFIETIPFFASLNFIETSPVNNNVRIKWFRKKEAEKVRNIVTGLVQMTKEEVDIKHLLGDDLDEKIEQIGKLRLTQTSVSKA